MKVCTLCPRRCPVDRRHGQTGICGQTEEIRIARAALHFWEEPCISGEKGSGAVFFCGCALHCVFCQNHDIAASVASEASAPGKVVSTERLAEIFLRLQEQGAHNINLVTPGQFLPQIIAAVEMARNQGLALPVVYNTSGYETVENLKRLEGIVDIYLPDFKYMDAKLAAKYSHAPDYCTVVKAAVAEMVRQTGPACFVGEEGDSLMKKGTIVRHLVLPGGVADSKAIIHYLYETYGDRIYISIMNQFTPLAHLENYPELNRKLTSEEYDEVVDYAIDLGVANGFIQEGETAGESFIPAFDGEGV